MTIDLLPTLVELCGAELSNSPIDGLDLWPLISGQPNAKSPHEAFDFYWGQHLQAVRSGKWKLHFPHDYFSTTPDNVGGDSRPGKPAQKKIELALFDLEKDRNETTNVADQHADVVARLTAHADKARYDLGDAATKQTGSGARKAGMVE